MTKPIYIWKRTQIIRALSDLAESTAVSFDTETNSLDVITAKVFLLAISNSVTTYVIDLMRVTRDDVRLLIPLFENPMYLKIAHNAAYDWKILYYHYGIYTRNIFDTLLAQKLLRAGLLSDNTLENVVYERIRTPDGVAKRLDKDVRKTFINATEMTIEDKHIAYVAEDVEYLHEIRRQQLEELAFIPQGSTQSLMRVMDLENSIIDVTAMMELTGIPLNKTMLESMRRPFQHYIQQVDEAFQDMLLDAGCVARIISTQEGYNVVSSTSDDQLLALFHKMGITVPSLNSKVVAKWDALQSKRKRKKQQDEDVDFTQYIDDTDVSGALTSFAGLENPYLKSLAYLKGLRIILSTFIEGVSQSIHPVTGRVHAGFNQLGAEATGRYSSSGPNFQNIPNDTKFSRIGLGQYSIRKCVEAPKGRVLIISDYSGIELVILAVLSGDTDLLHQITQGDIHSLITKEVLGYTAITPENKKKEPHKRWRDAAKKLSYSIAYGTTGRNAAETLNLDLAMFDFKITAEQGDELIDKWYKLFPKTAAYLQQNARQAQYVSNITTIPSTTEDSDYDKVTFVQDTWGRRRHWKTKYFFGDKGKWRKLAAGREGMNAPIQGTSATMTKRAMFHIHNKLDLTKARIILTVHDEIVTESLKSYQTTCEAIVKWGMEEAIKETLPSIAHMVGLYESLSAAPKPSYCYDK